MKVRLQLVKVKHLLVKVKHLLVEVKHRLVKEMVIIVVHLQNGRRLVKVVKNPTVTQIK